MHIDSGGAAVDDRLAQLPIQKCTGPRWCLHDYRIGESKQLLQSQSHGGWLSTLFQASGPEVIAEVNRAIAAGVWAGDPNAVVIVWDWGWPDSTSTGGGEPNWAEQIINMLPDNVYLMSVSEWGKPITRGGVASAVGEYSISAVGPGPRAQKHWDLARKRGTENYRKSAGQLFVGVVFCAVSTGDEPRRGTLPQPD